jgi:hypothetical protein
VLEHRRAPICSTRCKTETLNEIQSFTGNAPTVLHTPIIIAIKLYLYLGPLRSPRKSSQYDRISSTLVALASSSPRSPGTADACHRRQDHDVMIRTPKTARSYLAFMYTAKTTKTKTHASTCTSITAPTDQVVCACPTSLLSASLNQPRSPGQHKQCRVIVGSLYPTTTRTAGACQWAAPLCNLNASVMILPVSRPTPLSLAPSPTSHDYSSREDPYCVPQSLCLLHAYLDPLPCFHEILVCDSLAITFQLGRCIMDKGANIIRLRY